MNVSLYQAAAAMNANARWQEMISQNLASGSIPGYRKQEVSFSQIAAGLRSATGQAQHAVPMAVTATNFTQGPLKSTGSPTDVAMDGPGFFEVQMPNGDRGYTRDGEFQLNAQGQLVTKQGYTVMSDSGPVQVDPANSSPLSIAATGEISQGADVKGKLKMMEFAKPEKLTSIGNGYFLGKGTEATPQEAKSSSIRQGYIEASNTTTTSDMTSLITAMRAFEANQHALSMQDERMGQVISALGSPS